MDRVRVYNYTTVKAENYIVLCWTNTVERYIKLISFKVSRYQNGQSAQLCGAWTTW